MREVDIQPVPLERLAALLTPQRAARMRDVAARGRPLLSGRVVWNVNATAQGGGVAEMLQGLLAYGRGAGVDTRWLVLDGDPEFFATTKRLHNFLHGDPGDGRRLGPVARRHFVGVLQANLEQMAPLVRRGDIVLLHDPQTAGLVDGLREMGARVETTNGGAPAGASGTPVSSSSTPNGRTRGSGAPNSSSTSRSAPLVGSSPGWRFPEGRRQ